MSANADGTDATGTSCPIDYRAVHRSGCRMQSDRQTMLPGAK